MSWGGRSDEDPYDIEGHGYGGAFFDPITGKPMGGDSDRGTAPGPSWSEATPSAPPQWGQPANPPDSPTTPPEQRAGAPLGYGQQPYTPPGADQPGFDPTAGQQPYGQPTLGQPGGYRHPDYQRPGYDGYGQQPPGAPPAGSTGVRGWPRPTPPKQPPRTTGRNSALRSCLFAMVGVVALGIFLCVVLWIAVRTEHDSDDSAGAGSAPVSTPASTSTTPPPTTAAVVAGWQGVLDRRDGLVYDVPKDWKVDSTDTIVGFEKPDKSAPYGYTPVVTGHAPAEFPGDCTKDGTYRGLVAVTNAGKTAPAKAARNGASLWARAATMAKDGTMSGVLAPPARPLRLRTGSSGAFAAVAAANQDRSGGCPAPAVKVSAVAASIGGQTRLVMIITDRKIPHAVDDATVRAIASSVRPLR